ncbi:MAG: long-chain-fatty-acid--CoA ligase [Oceanicoccus sp.]|uniref:long-chain-fatty-acid--CoA ligase n=1 Tax=Oceanicoccus sp. TaxID=2691044 RepID=UPI00261169F3|nr:long-chain-fatty-acid--CoA ligase [Oceanicoccus sp.]MCP3909003.1 long-chain-fatty-acid--CoA ligase [Oceanicoccus sp.]MDG1771967.1 long-chain-fatty-acid--CoA ligase [Oceanicoccus sp.]
MIGQMMNSPLTITSLMAFGEKVYANSEIVSVTADNPLFRYTFADAFKRTRQLANALNTLGAKPGDCIGTLAWNDHRHFELYYGVSCSGMICHTMNPRLFPEQIDYIINHAEDQFIFTDILFLPLLESLKDRLSTVKGIIVLTDEAHMPDTSLEDVYCYETLLAAETDAFSWPEINELDASSLCYTSGTTGNPKGVLYNHRSTVLHALTGNQPSVMGLGENDAVLPIVPMFHVNAWGIPYGSVITGSKMVFPGPKMADGEALTTLINEENVTYSAGVPTIWLALLDYLKQSGKSIEPLKRVTVGGAACPLSIMEDFDKYGVYTHVGWGMTEMSPLGSYNGELDREALGEEEFARLRVKAGRCIYGVEMKITDEDNNEQPWDGEAFGSLKVRGPWICDSYFKMKDSDSHDADGWFDTGDVATIDPTGMMQITDRSKDVIKSGGEWISSIDLENTAVNHPSVVEAAVIGLYHEKWTERPLLLVTKQPGAELSREEMLAWFKGKVATWWIPDDCLFVEELPHTATGKLSKKDLREQYKDYRFPTT